MANKEIYSLKFRGFYNYIIQASSYASFAISKGKLWAWGKNDYGLLGINDDTIGNENTPVAVCGNHTFCKISSKFSHIIGLNNRGEAWGWGYNGTGCIGDGKTDNHSTPVLINHTENQTFCKISCGLRYTIGLDNNGRVWGWGDNSKNQTCVGDYGTVDWTLTNKVKYDIEKCGYTFCQVSTGFYHTLVIDNHGNAWAWGMNRYGQLGNNTDNGDTPQTPVKVCGNHTFCRILSVGNLNEDPNTPQSSYALDNRGKLWGWGDHYYFIPSSPKCTPVAIFTNKTFCEIDGLSDNFFLAIDNHNRVWAWGMDNSWGQLGTNNTDNYSTPVLICSCCNFNQISAGAYHSLGSKNYMIWSWGNNDNGQLGLGSYDPQCVPISIYDNNLINYLSISDAKINIGGTYKYVKGIAVNSGGTWKCVCVINTGYMETNIHTLYSDGLSKNWGWGYNENGQVGNGTRNNSYSTPVAVCGGHTFCKISVSKNTSFGLTSNGKMWGWGYGFYGQLGTNSKEPVYTPVAVCGGHTFCQISAGDDHTLGIDNHGKAWAWGRNDVGQLGDNSTTSKCTPISVYGVHTFCFVSCGSNHSMGLDINNLAWGWGNNNYGQLGIGTTVSKSTPTAIVNIERTFCKISLGGKFSMAIDTANNFWGWGYNNYGQLGRDNTKNYCEPRIQIVDRTFILISSGYGHVLSIDNHGKVWAWGSNIAGQLGTNSITSRSTPYSVCCNRVFYQISAGRLNSGGKDIFGTVYCWGENDFGQIGDNTTLPRCVPTRAYCK